MNSIDEDAYMAKQMGLSYGKYKALTYSLSAPSEPVPRAKKKGPKRKYTDEQVFELWQSGKDDTEISEIIGVSRTMVQRWRSNFELPSNNSHPNTSLYALVDTEYGLYAVLVEKEPSK